MATRRDGGTPGTNPRGGGPRKNRGEGGRANARPDFGFHAAAKTDPCPTCGKLLEPLAFMLRIDPTGEGVYVFPRSRLDEFERWIEHLAPVRPPVPDWCMHATDVRSFTFQDPEMHG